MAEIFLFRLVSTEPVRNMKIPSDTKNTLLSKPFLALESNIHEKEIIGHSPKHFRAKNLFKVEVGRNFFRVYLCSYAYSKNSERSQV